MQQEVLSEDISLALKNIKGARQTLWEEVKGQQGEPVMSELPGHQLHNIKVFRYLSISQVDINHLIIPLRSSSKIFTCL